MLFHYAHHCFNRKLLVYVINEILIIYILLLDCYICVILYIYIYIYVKSSLSSIHMRHRSTNVLTDKYCIKLDVKDQYNACVKRMSNSMSLLRVSHVGDVHVCTPLLLVANTYYLKVV